MAAEVQRAPRGGLRRARAGRPPRCVTTAWTLRSCESTSSEPKIASTRRSTSAPIALRALDPVLRGCGGADRGDARAGARRPCCARRAATRAMRPQALVVVVDRDRDAACSAPTAPGAGTARAPSRRRRRSARGCRGAAVAFFQIDHAPSAPPAAASSAARSCSSKSSIGARPVVPWRAPVGDLGDPAAQLPAVLVDVHRLPRREEVALHVAHAALDLALLLGRARRRRDRSGSRSGAPARGSCG